MAAGSEDTYATAAVYQQQTFELFFSRLNILFWDWLIGFNNVGTCWHLQPSYIYLQMLILVGSCTTFYHALKNGGRFIHLWIGMILHGLVVETLSYNLSDIDNFWHAQSPIIFLGRRLPLHIILIYVVLMYPAAIATDRLKLPIWSEPCAVGLATVLIDYPYDIMGVRLMHWTWHDTDPNISDKHYYVPWTSFYFHATFSASFSFWFHIIRTITFGKTKKWSACEPGWKEFMCTIIAAFLGMPGGVLLFIPLYHPLHDIYNIHSEITCFLLFAIYASLIWLSLSKCLDETRDYMNKTTNRIIFLYMTVYYFFFIGIASFIDPSSEVSIGWHEPIGPCNVTTSIQTASGHTLYKRKYLCTTDNDETYFGWSCLPNGESPADGASWYTICGTSYTNKIEYILILTAAAIVGLSFFFKTLFSNVYNNEEITYEHKLLVKENKKLKTK